MNERIKDFGKQAYDASTESWPINSKAWYEVYNTTFAELIVRECVTIINHGIDHTDYPHPNDTEKSMVEMKAQIWCRDAIKEHFGIK